MSAIHSRSCLNVGTVILFVSGLYSSSIALKYSSISSLGMSVPKSLLTASSSNEIVTGCLSCGYTSTIPETTVPAPSSSISWQALLIASSALFGSRPFSNLPDASVRRPSLLAESLMLVPSNVAASNKISLTLSVIIEFSPPMIPAIAICSSSSQIIKISLSKVLSWPSNVTNLSPSFARLTTIFCPLIVDKSNACIGWPYSSIT